MLYIILIDNLTGQVVQEFGCGPDAGHQQMIAGAGAGDVQKGGAPYALELAREFIREAYLGV
jgi:hypothetical protein